MNASVVPPDRQITLFSETDPYGTILFVNDAFCEVSKFTREELLGRPHSIIRHPDMPQRLFALLWETIKAGEVFRGILKNIAKDGTHYWVRARIMPVHDGRNEISRYVGVRHLITEDVVAQTLYDEQKRKLNL